MYTACNALLPFFHPRRIFHSDLFPPKLPTVLLLLVSLSFFLFLYDFHLLCCFSILPMFKTNKQKTEEEQKQLCKLINRVLQMCSVLHCLGGYSFCCFYLFIDWVWFIISVLFVKLHLFIFVYIIPLKGWGGGGGGGGSGGIYCLAICFMCCFFYGPCPAHVRTACSVLVGLP